MSKFQFANGRWYVTPDGAWVPSVTTVLGCYPKGKGFEKWLGGSGSYDEAIAQRDAAGERGAIIHDSIAALLDGLSVELPKDADPKVSRCLVGFINWWEETQPELIESEVFLVGDGYAGTGDLVCEIKGQVWVIDYKSSSGIYTSHHLQTAAYSRAAVRQGLVPFVDCRGILHLKHTTKKGWQMVLSDALEYDDYAAFRACKEIYHREYGYNPVPFGEQEDIQRVFTLEERE